MTDYFSMVGIEQFSDKVADKIIERGADKIAERVVEKIEPIIARNSLVPPKKAHEEILTRKEAAALIRVSEPTLREMYTDGRLKAYGLGTRRMRFLATEVLDAMDK